MIVVDTNVISEPLKPESEPRVVEWIDAQAIETLYLSAITVAELRFSVAVLPPGRRRSLLSSRLEDDVLALFRDRILPFGEAESVEFARLLAAARTRGHAIGKADGYIAATASVRGYSVATRDTSPFHAAGLSVVDPWT